MAKFVLTTWAAFLARQKPVSTRAKPACMKITSAAPKITKRRFSDVFTCPRSAAISSVVGLPATLAVTSPAPPVDVPVGSPARARPAKRNVMTTATASAASVVFSSEGRVHNPRASGAAHRLRADPGLELIIVVILCGPWVRGACARDVWCAGSDLLSRCLAAPQRSDAPPAVVAWGASSL